MLETTDSSEDVGLLLWNTKQQMSSCFSCLHLINYIDVILIAILTHLNTPFGSLQAEKKIKIMGIYTTDYWQKE